MQTQGTSRRNFLKTSTVLTAAAAAGGMATGEPISATQPAAGTPPATKHPIRLGAPVFKAPTDPEALARAHREKSYRAAYCPPVGINDRERIRDIRTAFQRNDVVIAEVGRWCNLLDPDAEKRKANLERVTEGLALADELGALCCVDIAGSFNADVWYGPHPDNLSDDFFDAAVENARKIIDAVKPRRAKFCYEMMGWSLPDSPDAYLRMLKAVDREAFGVHLDPCNLVNCPAKFYDNTALINECFDKLGPWIVSCHAKDLKWQVEMNVHFVEVTLGEGQLDYKTYLKRLAQLPNDVPLMIEHMKGPAEYEASRQFLFKTGGEIGVLFEYV
ncbi:MAG: sugar phosphate isomerase/epimerase [Planctomycetota bacterium]|nr:MAG: sugar phosphate isomerase/epimerase [Planctomycetota bacterium]